MHTDIDHDRAVIDDLGGPTAVARRLGWYPGGVQRVSNWRNRGIPALVRLQRPDLFPLPGRLPDQAVERAGESVG